MAHVLIAFLGRVARSEKGYRTATYRFPDGSDTGPTAFVGWSLCHKLQPDRMVVLGTSGSMWDVLVETADLGDEAEDARLALYEAKEARAVDQAMLDRITPHVGRWLGVDLKLALIPYGSDAGEQVQVLAVMAKHVGQGDRVSLDVTHGFRHLPMLALMSALHLRATRAATIAGISYGALDPDTGEALVYELGGLLHIADWVVALARYDQSGDYGVFAPLLEKDGVPGGKARCLSDAAFYERTLDVSHARQRLTTFLPILEEGLPGTGELFTQQLAERIGWVRHSDRFAHQRRLARLYLETADYPRAAIFAYEAFITSLLEEGEDVGDADARENAVVEFRDGKRGDATRRGDLKRLAALRNALAHGTRPKDERVRRITRGPRELRETLTSLMDRLLDAPASLRHKGRGSR